MLASYQVIAPTYQKYTGEAWSPAHRRLLINRAITLPVFKNFRFQKLKKKSKAPFFEKLRKNVVAFEKFQVYFESYNLFSRRRQSPVMIFARDRDTTAGDSILLPQKGEPAKRLKLAVIFFKSLYYL